MVMTVDISVEVRTGSRWFREDPEGSGADIVGVFEASRGGKTRINCGHDSGYLCRGSNWTPLMCVSLQQ